MPARRDPIRGLPKVEPWKPVDYEPEDAHAVQAVMRGTASEEQQRRAMRFLVSNVCGTYDLSFRPGEAGDRETAFAEGKRFVGLQLVKFANVNLAALRGKNTEQGTPAKPPKEQP